MSRREIRIEDIGPAVKVPKRGKRAPLTEAERAMLEAKRKEWENLLATQMHASQEIPPFQREFLFHLHRKWRADFGWPEYGLLVEVEGVSGHAKNRHQGIAGYTLDCEKYDEATIEGWAILRFVQSQIKSGYALDAIERWFRHHDGRR